MYIRIPITLINIKFQPVTLLVCNSFRSRILKDVRKSSLDLKTLTITLGHFGFNIYSNHSRFLFSYTNRRVLSTDLKMLCLGSIENYWQTTPTI